jgi:transketolase
MSLSPRDVFLSELLEFAKKDDSIVLMSVDMGAPALDLWREQVPLQVLDMGIAEQNAINVAAGLSKGGKKVFVYFMAAWIHRCYEQIRYSCCMAQIKVNILGNGVGMGYAPAGPAHQPNEDIAVMRALHNMSILTASETRSVKDLVKECLESNVSNYVRLERKSTYIPEAGTNRTEELGWAQKTYFGSGKPTHLIVSYGYMAGRIKKMMIDDPSFGEKIALLDLIRIWPINLELIDLHFENIEGILFIEEQTKSGSVSEAIISGSKVVQRKKFATIHLPNRYIFDNLEQEEILNKYGFDKSTIYKSILSL